MSTMNKKRNQLVTLEKEVWKTDPETGNEVMVRQEFTRKVTKDNFIQAYVEGIRGMLKIESKPVLRVLIALWEKAEYNTNELILIKPIKEDIAKELGYKNYRVVDNAIAKLVKKKILFKKGKSVYYLDPNLYFKGTSSNRIKAIEVVFKLQQTD